MKVSDVIKRKKTHPSKTHMKAGTHILTKHSLTYPARSIHSTSVDADERARARHIIVVGGGAEQTTRHVLQYGAKHG
jgi:hypothetical protein